MRVLVAIPHFFDLTREAHRGPGHGALLGDPGPRMEALTACLSALHQLFGGPQVLIDISSRETKSASSRFAAAKLDVVICTTRGRHLFPRLTLEPGAFSHRATDAEPLLFWASNVTQRSINALAITTNEKPLRGEQERAPARFLRSWSSFLLLFWRPARLSA
jgi:hypothetical protein